MTPIRTTFGAILSRTGLETLSRLQDREIESIVEAVTDGRLVGVVDQKAGEIVGALTPEYADQLCAAPDTDARDNLTDGLASLRQELKTLRQIVAEVMAEEEPGDFEYLIHDCIYDAEEILARTESIVEGM